MQRAYFFAGALAASVQASAFASEKEMAIFEAQNAMREDPEAFIGTEKFNLMSPTQKPVDQLWWNDGLAVSARIHCADSEAVGATGSDGSSPFERMKRYGKYQRRAGENVQYGKSDPTEIVKKIYESAGRRRNMFRTHYKEVGIAFCEDPNYGWKTVIEYADQFEQNEMGRLAIVEFKEEYLEELEKKKQQEELNLPDQPPEGDWEEPFTEEVKPEVAQPETEPIKVEDQETEPVTEIEQPDLEQDLDEDPKQSLPVWFWPVIIGTAVALLLITGLIICYACAKKQTPQEQEKSEVSEFKEKSCFTKVTDCFKAPPSRPASAVEETPSKNVMVQEDEESGKKEDSSRQIIDAEAAN